MNPLLAIGGALAVLICGLVSAGSAFMAAGAIMLDRPEDDVFAWILLSVLVAVLAALFAFAMAVAR